ncbi:MAG: hypothetical protein NW226_12370 [Microscillaceae bacterium]|nr:hypothetical protein [Microscillaceae bacterium]
MGRRNGIAHGDGKFKDGVTERQYNDFKRAFDKIVNLLPPVITKALTEKLYLKPEFR